MLIKKNDDTKKMKKEKFKSSHEQSLLNYCPSVIFYFTKQFTTCCSALE